MYDNLLNSKILEFLILQIFEIEQFQKFFGILQFGKLTNLSIFFNVC